MVYNYNCLITFILVVLGIVFLIWIIYPHLMNIKNNNLFIINNNEKFLNNCKNSNPVNYSKNNQNLSIKQENYVQDHDLQNTNVGAPVEPRDNLQTDFYLLDDGANKEMAIHNNICSRSCCSSQWSVPFKVNEDPYVCENSDNLLKSPMLCQNDDRDSGCLCISKKQHLYMKNRMMNGSRYL